MSQTSVNGAAEPTGDPRVDAVVARLGDLGDLDLAAQLEVFGELHASLATILDSQPDHDVVPDDAPLPASWATNLDSHQHLDVAPDNPPLPAS